MRQFNYVIPVTGDRYFKASETINFELTGPGNALKPGSLYMTGDLEVRTGVTTYGAEPTGTGLNDSGGDTDVKLDEYAGAHSLFHRFDSAVDQGSLENISYYPRLIRQLVENKAFNEALMNESDKAMALIMGEKNFENRSISALTPTDGKIKFAIRPLIALNSCNAPLSFDRAGVVKVSAYTNTVQEALYGDDNSSTVGYWLSNVKLWYEVVPDANPDAPVTFQRYQMVSSTVNSNNVNISHLMPGLTNSMYSSYILTTEAASYTANSLKTAKLPKVSRVTFAFNDADNVRVSYPVENNEELEMLAQRAISVDGPNSLRLSRQQQANARNEGYGIGISFGQLVNTSKNKFDLNIISESSGGVDNDARKYYGYLYFRGIAQL